jgi:RNA polymerase sigma factor (sigma-70 family)
MKGREALKADERALLEELLRETGPLLMGYVRKAYGDRFDAEEIVAETFARAADNIAALRECKRQDLYLLTVARNLCRDAFRRRRPATFPNEQFGNWPGTESSPDRHLARSEERQHLLAAVARLPLSQREVVVLRLSAGLKFEQIAELLQIPLGTALSRMNAALGRLRKELGFAHAYKRS